MKKVIFFFALLFLPLAFLTACGTDSRPSLEDRIGGMGIDDRTSFEGVVKALQNLDLYQEGTHQLVTDAWGTVIIQSPTIDLSRYLDEKVVVKGTMKKGVGELKSVFTVTDISYADESKSAQMETYENQAFGFSFSRPSTWRVSEKQSALSLIVDEKPAVTVTIFSDKTDLTAFAKSQEKGVSTEVTIGAQKALRFTSGDTLSFYVLNPPKKKIYQIIYTPTINAVDDAVGAKAQSGLFYDLLDSFKLLYLTETQGEKCGGTENLKCSTGSVCQLESDAKDAEGTCSEVGGSASASNCPFIAPPTNCKEYRISEYSLKGCPSRYECVSGTSASYKQGASTPSRDLNVVDTGRISDDFKDAQDDKENKSDEKEPSQIESEVLGQKPHDVPPLSEVTAEYKSEKKGFSLLYPKKWYYASFGSTIGFADASFENSEDALITLTVSNKDGGVASKKIGDNYYRFDGPADLSAVMKAMLDSVETFDISVK